MTQAIKFFSNKDNNEPKLFLFYLSGKIKKCNIEIHDVVFVVGKSNVELENKIKERWIGTSKSLHIDSWFRVDNIDGFNIKISQSPIDSLEHKLFFVNLGYYLQDNFGENHFMSLTVGKSREEAAKAAKNKLLGKYEMLHTDNIYNIDECIKLEQVDNYHIALKYTGVTKSNIIINGYQKLGLFSIC